MFAHVFQYSLRIVGFRDFNISAGGSVTPFIFQYSLRIVGFRDGGEYTPVGGGDHLSVFPANRGVPRLPWTRQSMH